ncbi:aspartyl/asparaginyl beta-hydroxylase domain-containing protein [Chitinimonas arctica]|uniref:Aspartyl/asparaginyl beta-hydroxylase domain-containing protein n=1 Tax=Chitinimonas arctica TaxID=2594795 RepID=A0A516SIL4_9NEIS|nr:aspartyl/asparaginyl beta-hydroxylase domain-containing protein [Chitinimonas arctica]QDQ27991.1 aspartyl/asparaginyl beta-hydroxylase domain-containing protein [Chitinimonas arctica]
MFLPKQTLPAAVTLEAHWHTILAECLALPHDEFAAWPERPLYNQGWDVYGLFAGGVAVRENCVFCPATATLLASLPGLVNAGFSRLAAGTRIQPHTGYSRAVLRLHLGLRIGGDCGLRVGSEQRGWHEGHCLVFDDTVEHEAWNHGPGDRLVLLADFSRPPERVG